MSHKASAWASVQLPDTPFEKLVLLMLADFHRNDTGLCFPSAITVGELCRCNEKTVRNCLGTLQAQGFIWVTKRNRQPALISFNWNRKGTYQFKKRSTDSRTVEEKETPQRPDWVGDVEDENTATDSGTVEEKSTDSQDQSTDSQDSSTDSDAKSTVPRTDEPGNQGINQDNHIPDERKPPDKKLLEIENWEPDEITLESLKVCGVPYDPKSTITFRLKMLDWKDNGFKPNIRNKFLTHCREEQANAENQQGGKSSNWHRFADDEEDQENIC